MFPVRCYTCGDVLAQHYKAFEESMRAQTPANDFLHPRGLRRMCCKRMYLTHVDLTVHQLEYPNKDVVLDENGTLLRRDVRFERCVSCD